LLLYLSLFICLGGWCFVDYIKLSNLNKFFLVAGGTVVIFLVFWTLASLRWKTGTDWNNYYDGFYYFSDVYRQLFEPGFGYLIEVVRNQTDNYTVFLTVFSFLCLAFKFSYFFKYHSETIFTVLFLYFCYYFADIFAVRQNLAISLTLFSTIFIIQRKPLYFAIFVGIATSMHFTAALYFAAYYIYWAKIPDKYFYVLIVLSVLFGLLSIDEKLLNLGLKIVGVNGRLGEKINTYLNGGDGSDVGPGLITFILGTIKRCIFIPIFIFIRNKTRDTDPKIQGYFNLYMVGNIIYFMFAKDLAVFARASVSFLFFEIFLVCYTINYFRKSRKTLAIVYAMIILIAFSRFISLVNSYRDLYVPYYSIFDKNIPQR
jgi:ABC-type proline/glycine betaine transport system permease subunit